jgi:hypothetical protein
VAFTFVLVLSESVIRLGRSLVEGRGCVVH